MSDFPVTARDKVEPADPKTEMTREQVNAQPEDLVARMLRTRRYFRLTHQRRKTSYARGLDSRPEDMA